MAPKPSVPHSSPATAKISTTPTPGRALKTAPSSNPIPTRTSTDRKILSKSSSSNSGRQNITNVKRNPANRTAGSNNRRGKDDVNSSQSQLAVTAQNDSNANGDENADSTNLIANDPSTTAMGSMGSPLNMGMGMGMGMGMSPYGGYGMGMGMGGMGMGMGGMGMGPGGSAIMQLNQYVFGFQSLIFSLGQAVQVVGMNTQALHHLYEQLMGMMDQGLKIVHEMRTLENQQIQTLSEEDQKRRRRLKALRWSLMFGISYAGYSFVAKWLRRRKEYKRRKRIQNGNAHSMNNPTNPNLPGRTYAQKPGAGMQPYGHGGYTNTPMNSGYGYDHINTGGSYGQQNYYPSNTGYGYSGDYNSYSPY